MNKKELCPHFSSCPGCCEYLYEPHPPVWKDVLNYFKDKVTVPLLHQGNAIHWRMRSKLAVRGSAEHPLIGLFKKGTHDVVPIPFCLAHHPRINQTVEFVNRLIKKHQLKPYQEKTGSGEIRYLQCVVERKTGKVQLAFVLNYKNASDERVKWWKNFLAQIGQNDLEGHWHSLWINLNNKPTNTIFGPQWLLCHGEELLWESFGDLSVCYQPASFAQANLNLFEKMLFHLKNFIHDQSKVAEFYAGVGVIGLFVVSKCLWVRCSEINLHSESCFLRSKSTLNDCDAAKISFHTGSAKELLSILEGANTVIVDPPRKGLDTRLLKAINENMWVKQLIYMSCGWDAFKRDCRALLEAGWRLENADGYIFFPGSDHIEMLASFKR